MGGRLRALLPPIAPAGLIVGLLLGLTVGLLAGRPQAAEPPLRYFRIATGPSSSGAFTAGTVIAAALTNPPGSWPCERGGTCGVPGLIGVTQASAGGLENLDLLRSGAVDAALVDASLATAALRGPLALVDLRVLATLFTEAVHLMVPADSAIHHLAELRGRTIAVGEPAADSARHARIVLEGLGLPARSFTPVSLPTTAAVDRMVERRLDALFLVGPAPLAAVTTAADRLPIRLLAIDPAAAQPVRSAAPAFTDIVIPAETYPGVAATPTLGVDVLLVVRAGLDAELAYGVTRVLWQPTTRRELADDLPNGNVLPQPWPATAVPLHDAAIRYYRETAVPPDQ